MDIERMTDRLQKRKRMRKIEIDRMVDEEKMR